MEEVTWSRIVMNEDILRLAGNICLNATRLSILEISGHRWSVIGDNTKYKRLNWPDYDICENKLDEKFNLVIAEMVFEHVAYPYKAGKNVYDMIDDNGYFLISVPFLFPLHRYPIDCCRWSAEGLRYFLHECGFPIEGIYTNAWGNRNCLNEICQDKFSMVMYDKDNHSLTNEENYPIVVWGLAKKSR